MFFRRFQLPSGAFSTLRGTSGVGYREAPVGQHQIGKREQGKQLRRVLRQAAIARLAMTEQVPHDMERMLNFRSHARLELLKLFLNVPQLVLRQDLALGALHRDVPRYRFALIFRALFDALIACSPSKTG